MAKPATLLLCIACSGGLNSLAAANGALPDAAVILDKSGIARLVNEIDGPINIIAGDGTPSPAELEEIGVARVSLGPRPFRATLALLRRIARELLDTGSYTRMTNDTISYSEVNKMFERDAGTSVPSATLRSADH